MAKTRSSLEAAGLKQRTANISERVKKIVVSPIKEMRILAEKVPGAISFGQGMPYVDTPLAIKEKLVTALKTKDISKYSTSPGLPELRKALAERVMKKRGLQGVKPEEILVTVGAMEGLGAAVMTVINPGDEVIVVTPGFSSHIEQILLAGGVPKFVPLIEKIGWQLDVNAFKKAITKKTKAIILCNPNNPTGSVYSKKDLQEIEQLVLKHNIILILDEPYDFLLYDNATHYSPASNPALKNNLIACFSFSKEFAMTGYRIGYVYADSGIINQMMKVHDAFCICAARISQEAALAALEISDEFTKDLVKKLDYNRKLVMKWLDKMPDIRFQRVHIISFQNTK
ncbi:pyridoxal phosphate-dependent aminotransferase [Candidatus Woesearchaeota archaeon]|nr:pyridoxal phosphate-dependent aminotransferase [Candidatus Woesearchaeota archaeon]